MLCFWNLNYLFYFFQGPTTFAYEKSLFRCDVLANYSKNVWKSESSGGFFWKKLPGQRKRRGQHQLIVNWKVSNTRFSDGSVGLWNSNQSFAIFKVKHKLWEGKLKFRGYYYMVDSYQRELYSVFAKTGSIISGTGHKWLVAGEEQLGITCPSSLSPLSTPGHQWLVAGEEQLGITCPSYLSPLPTPSHQWLVAGEE